MRRRYVVRRLEDTIYELSLFPPPEVASTSSLPASTKPPTGSLTEPRTEQSAITEDTPFVDVDALAEAREAYAALDAAREAVIKRCREPQKLAKQASAPWQPEQALRRLPF